MTILFHIFLDVEENLYGTVYPQVQAVYKGSNIYIICYSITPPEWSKKGFPMKDFTIINEVLILTNVKVEDSGIYYCNGRIQYEGRRFTAQSEVYVGGNILTYSKAHPS